ncbi:LLM class flavin-dependent oxidoreductase [Ancylobacter sp. Lp-2]|uniref:LLM class flavin-dependent oxidoreductase n=1 Tax=Ancylobacter sp. Lp-2 TaxID=2881339 RepID=UPI001E5440EA|nr:LLM class flavin-dependent oxidoreductase [Ancylobacter sp. Lp-2]MCB4770445.1 LLM class flavin-dependent oxidoreductase [Ancylobacter sp. Lp-2]
MSARHMHLNVNVLPSGSHPASWRAPGGNPSAFIDVGHYQNIARIAERGLLDAVFLADALNSAPDPSFGPAWALDPVVIVASMAVATTHVGFIATASTTFSQPYNVARAFSSLDHASGGRVGWNVVTTYDQRAAGNFGLRGLPDHGDRYARAAEFVDVVLALWESWEDGALLAERDTGRFADASRIHRIDHAGKHFSVTGPLQLPRTPQGRPLLVQAGSSDQGRDLAARYAEAVFSVQQVVEEARAYYADVKERARRLNRDPSSIAILPGLSLTIGGTEEEALARKRELDAIGEEGALKRFAARLGVDVGELDYDKPVPDHLIARIEAAKGSRGFIEATVAVAKDSSLTVRQIIARGGGGHRLIAGTPEQIADHMQEWFTTGAADGFNIMCDVFPEGLAAFVDQVVPILQRRGLFRTAYGERTLRARYGLPWPTPGARHERAAS